MSDTEYYDALGAQKGEDADSIKKKYRKLAMKSHPDQQHDKTDAEKAEAAKKMAQINAAWEVLQDPVKRNIYDQYGKAGLEQAAAGQKPGSTSGATNSFRDAPSFTETFEQGLGKVGQKPDAKPTMAFKKRDPFAAFRPK